MSTNQALQWGKTYVTLQWGKTYVINSVNDMIRAIVDQTQPTSLAELVVGMHKGVDMAPSTVLDHLNDLVQQGAVKLDDSGRFTI